MANLYKNLKAGRDLLQALGIWTVLGPVISAVASIPLTIWAAIKGLAGPQIALVFLGTFLLVLAISFIVVLLWKAATIPDPIPLPAASMPSWAGQIETRLIKARPQLVLLYDPSVPAYKLRNTGSVDALNIKLLAQKTDSFLIKWEVHPNMVPANSERVLQVCAYSLDPEKKLADNPLEIMKVVYAEDLSKIDKESLTLMKGTILKINFKFSYENFEHERFESKSVIVFDCFTEQISVRA